MAALKFTKYFESTRERADRADIELAWIERAVWAPTHELAQADGRFRRWVCVEAAQSRWLRVVVLADGVTVHNAFFDRSFKP